MRHDLYWYDIPGAAIAAAIAGDRRTFERLLAAPNARFALIREAIRTAGERILVARERTSPDDDAAGVAPHEVRKLLGKSRHWLDSDDLEEQRSQVDRELRARIAATHPDRLASGTLDAVELRRRLEALATEHAALLNAARAWMRAA